MDYNFLYIETFLRKDLLIFIDVSQALSGPIFKENGLKVKYKYVIDDESSRYYWVVCKIHSKDSKKFVKSMKELSDKMRSCGFTDYEAYCKRVKEFIDSDKPITLKKTA